MLLTVPEQGDRRDFRPTSLGMVFCSCYPVNSARHDRKRIQGKRQNQTFIALVHRRLTARLVSSALERFTMFQCLMKYLGAPHHRDLPG